MYLCEKVFSTLMLKTLKYWSSLKNIEDALNSVVSNVQPRFSSVYKHKQAHPSHRHADLDTPFTNGKIASWSVNFFRINFFMIYSQYMFGLYSYIVELLTRVTQTFLRWRWLQVWKGLRSPDLVWNVSPGHEENPFPFLSACRGAHDPCLVSFYLLLQSQQHHISENWANT